MLNTKYNNVCMKRMDFFFSVFWSARVIER